MTPDPQAAVAPERAPVSILERLAPSLSFALLAISGAAGAMSIKIVFRALGESESVGLDAFYSAMAEVHALAGGILAAAALAGMLGIGVAAVRMFTTNRTSSPPGVLFLLPAGISFISPLITGYAGWLAISTVNNPYLSGIGEVSNTIWVLNWTAIAATAFALVFLVAFAFIPFTSRHGRKYTPVVFLLVIEAAIVAITILFFLVLRMCMSLTSNSFF